MIFHDEQKEEKIASIAAIPRSFSPSFLGFTPPPCSKCRQLWSCCRCQLIHPSAEYPTTEQKGPLAQRHTTRPSSRAWTARRWENTWDFLTTGNRTPGLVSATWIFMWISRQLWSSKNDLGHLMTRSLIVNPSVLPGRAVLCLEAARRPLVCLSPQTGVRKVTCCVDSFFFKNKKKYLFDWTRSQLQHQWDL